MPEPKRDSKKRRRRTPRTQVKPRKWRTVLEPQRSQATYDDLKHIERTSTQTKIADEPRQVPIRKLVIAERAFQWRGEHSDIHAEERHMRALMRGLEINRKLQPIVVLKLGKKLYVVDGHHRLAAYAALGYAEVPVVYFEGSLEAAFLKSLDINIRDKLPMTLKDKLEAAFRLVKHKLRYSASMTWEEIARRAIVSERLVYKMQATLREHPEAREWSWGKTLGEIQNVGKDYEPGSDEFRDEHARKMADQIMAKVRMSLLPIPTLPPGLSK